MIEYSLNIELAKETTVMHVPKDYFPVSWLQIKTKLVNGRTKNAQIHLYIQIHKITTAKHKGWD